MDFFQRPCIFIPVPILLFHFGLTEFDNWYAESFLNQTDDISSSAAGHGMRPGVILPFNPNQVVSY